MQNFEQRVYGTSVLEINSDDESALVYKSAAPIIEILEDEEANNEYVPNYQ